MRKITLFVDEVKPGDIGGMTNNFKKAELILAYLGVTFDILLKKTPDHVTLPTFVFDIGRFVLFINFDRNLANVNFGFINHKIDLNTYFDVFADTLSPQAVQGFHDLKQIIKQKDEDELNRYVLSDNYNRFTEVYNDFLKNKE
jgi:hypothetical protein